MRNFAHEHAVLKRKINEGSIIEADLQIATDVARALGSTESRVIFAKVKKILNDKAEVIDGGIV